MTNSKPATPLPIYSQKNLSPACSHCRSRKVKCDRKTPCSNCVKRSTQDSCSYDIVNQLKPNSLSRPKVEKDIFRPVSVFPVRDSSSGLPSEKNTNKRRKVDGQPEPSLTIPPEIPRTDTTLNREFKEYDYTGINPYVSDCEVIDFYSSVHGLSTDEKSLHLGPLSLKFITTKDLAINFFFEFEQEIVQHEEELRQQRVREQKKRKRKSNPCKDQDNADEEEHYEETSGSKIREKFQETKDEDLILKSMLSIEPQEKTFLDKVLENLPKKRLIKELLQAYFDNIQVISTVDEDEFKESMQDIWGDLDENPDAKLQHLNVRHPDDLARLGMSLILIRLGFLSLVSTNESIIGKNDPRSSSLKEDGFFDIKTPTTTSTNGRTSLILNPASLTFIELSEECFKKFNLLITPSFTLLQYALLIRQYQNFSPEFSQGNESSAFQLFTGVLVQMAYSLNLNKDPDHLLAVQTPREKNIRRKVWYTIMSMDLLEACHYGTRLNCDSSYYDTKVPYYYPDPEQQEQIGNNCFKGYLNHTRDLLRVILDISGKAKLCQLTSKMSTLERFYQDAFGDLQDILFADSGKNDVEERKLTMRTYLSNVCFFLSTYVHIVLHYIDLKNSEMSYFYTRKGFTLQFLKFLPFVFRLIFKTEDYFDKSASFVLIPAVLETIKRCFFACVSLYIRLRFAQYTWKKNPNQRLANEDLSETVDQILAGLNRILNLYLVVTTKLSYRYYFAWDLSRALKRALNQVIKNDQFYKTYYPGAVSLRTIPYNNIQMKELLSILNLGLEKFKSVEKGTDQHKMKKNRAPAHPSSTKATTVESHSVSTAAPVSHTSATSPISTLKSSINFDEHIGVLNAANHSAMMYNTPVELNHQPANFPPDIHPALSNNQQNGLLSMDLAASALLTNSVTPNGSTYNIPSEITEHRTGFSPDDLDELFDMIFQDSSTLNHSNSDHTTNHNGTDNVPDNFETSGADMGDMMWAGISIPSNYNYGGWA
ncbi:hypothetical protein WICPIJ_006611 [Wickerhamomyces pijperi]|uniref:Zn(2)-C6 fungal-type domain-containing protein n=1 Tax=Wickerhamomyces pijperi TaxID=599730 RepID=A0A9P8Q3D9_WICPI|nr:hypothetical protein WICPIJ_006611 [Wickerhamomyces pijperi]